MKRLKNISFLLILIMLFGVFASCKKNENNNESELKETGYYLTDNGWSNYKIVIPKEATKKEQYAANELVYFISLSGDCNLSIVTDENKTFDKETYYISIGNTSILKTSGIEIDNSNLGESGYILKTVGKMIIIASSTDGNGQGCVYGVYEFLEKTINYRYYASDEINYDILDKINVYAFDISYVPSLNTRTLGFYRLLSDNDYATRMKLLNTTSEEWGMWGHSQIYYVLKTSEYYEEHKDWYSAQSGGQLDWTNPEMRSEFVKRMIEIIQEKPDAKYFMIAQEDNGNYYKPEKAYDPTAYERLGGYSGMQMDFANYVAENVDAWIAENDPGRKVEYIVFAYQGTEAPPVIENADGTFEAVCDQVIPSENVRVFIAPIGTDYAYNLEDINNAGVYKSLKGWQAIADGKIMIYSYSIDFYHYMIQFNNFGTMEDIYRTYDEIGAVYVYDQNSVDSNTVGFEEMRIYVQAHLLWNTSLHYEDLVKEFMSGYYKIASDAMYEYYKYLRSWYAYLQGEKNLHGTIYANIGSSSLWPKLVIDQMENILNKALDQVNELKESDEETYTKLYYRIKKESMMSLYLKLKYYLAYYSDGEVAKMKEEFIYLANYFNIGKVAETARMNSFLDTLK